MKREADICFLLASIASAFMILSACAMFYSYYSIPLNVRIHKEKNEHIRIPETFYEKPIWAVLQEHKYIMKKIDSVPVTLICKRLVLYDEYKMFITAYCAEECGWSYSTSSGAICHRSSWENRYEPTTCAIDRSYFSYGTLFYIPSEDRIYVAEDTGPGVRGYWIDTYQDDMSDVTGYNTRYEYCYTCDIEEYSETFYARSGLKKALEIANANTWNAV